MKSAYLFLVGLFLVNLGYGQACLPDGIVLSTQEEIDSFAVNYPGCTEVQGYVTVGNGFYSDLIDNLDGLNQLESVGGLHIHRNMILNDMSGLENIHTINGSLIIETNWNITDLGFQNLDSIGWDIIIEANPLLTNVSGIGQIKSNCHWLTISDNDELIQLPNFEHLDTVRRNLEIISNDKLLDLNGLNSINSIGALIISNNPELLSLNGLQNLSRVTLLQLTINPKLETLSHLENLQSINPLGLRIWNNDNLINLDGLESVVDYGGVFNCLVNASLTNIDGIRNFDKIHDQIAIAGNNSLSNIEGLEFIDISDVDNISIHGNPNLSFCNNYSLCYYLSDGSDASVYDNAVGCNSIWEVITSCEFPARINSIAFLDYNQNKLYDNHEFIFDDILMELTPSDFAFLSQNIMGVNPGSYTITYNQSLNPNWQLTTDSTSHFVSLQEGELEEVTFGIYPLNQISHIVTTIASPPTRCNDLITFDITTKNLGTTIASGTTWFQYDENIEQIQFMDQPDTTITTLNYYGWDFTDLYPGQSITWQVEIQIPGPPDFAVGGELNFVTYTDFTDINGEDSSEGFRYNPEVQCSFDPNDKLINPSRYHYEALLDEDLIYTIRFQNTGNDVAYDVVIKDTLDVNLDLRTFRVLGSSHADKLSTSMTDDGVLTFEFRNIFLPDSTTNFEGSQGYVSYMIRANENVENNTVIRNSAGIYFDQNPPVITNTTLSVMVDMLTSIESPISQNIIVFPNPNTGEFEIQGVYQGQYEIIDISGRVVQSGHIRNNKSIDISNQAQGIYFIIINSNNNVSINKIIKHK